MKHKVLFIFTLLLFIALPDSASACRYAWEEGYELDYDDVYVGKLVDYSRSEKENEYSKTEVTETFDVSIIKAYYGDKTPGEKTVVKKLSRGTGSSCDVYPVFNDNNVYDPEADYYMTVNIYGDSDTMVGDGPQDTTVYVFASTEAELEESIANYDDNYAQHYEFEPGLPEIVITEEEPKEPSSETDNSYLLKQIKQLMEMIAALQALIVGRN